MRAAVFWPASKRALFPALAAALLLLAACGKPDPTTQAAAADPIEPRYEATLAQGIDFTRPGYPNFVAEVSGMSSRESWGRWSDTNAGAIVKFRFTRPLPKKFTLVLKATAFGPNMGQPVVVRVGILEKRFVVTNTEGNDNFEFDIADFGGADSIEIVPPKPVRPKDADPKSSDARQLGVGLVSLKIRD